MNQNIDQKIADLFQVLNEQKKEVELTEQTSKRSWVTNCSFKHKGEIINLQTASVPALTQMLADLLIQEDYVKKASAILEVETQNQYSGFTFAQWKEDCIKRIAIIRIKDKKQKLAELEKRLSAIVSPEQRRQMELEEITKSLGV